MGKLTLLLALLAVSISAHAQGYTPWRYAHAEWIDGRAHFVSARVARGIELDLECGPETARTLQLRWDATLPAGVDLRSPHISFRVDERDVQRLSGVRVTTLEGGRRILVAPLPIGGDWAQSFKAGRQLVIRIGADFRVPSGSWRVPDRWESHSNTMTVSLMGFTAAYNSLPERCRQAPSSDR